MTPAIFIFALTLGDRKLPSARKSKEVFPSAAALKGSFVLNRRMIGVKFLDLILTRSPCAIGISRSPSILPDVTSVAPANCATLNFRISKLPSYSDASTATPFNCSPFNRSRLIFNNTFASNPANADTPLNGLMDSACLVFCLPAVTLSPFEFVDTISGFDFEGMGIYASAFI